MKINCQDCQFRTPTGCSKNSKNGYFNCNKFRSIPIDVLKKEYYSLMVSGLDSVRMQYLEDKLKTINGGTI